MENLDGALAFRATLDIDDFNVSAQAMERQIRHVSTTTVAEAEDMEQSLLSFARNGAAYITTYLVGQGMMGLVQSIATTRGQFQQLEIAFETMLGSASKAKTLMDDIVHTAAITPFDLMGVASGAKQLMAYGESAEKVNDTLIKLGNIAAGLSIPLNDIVYLYGTTMVQGRLYAQDVRQFTGRGIPLVKELAEMYGVTAEEINNMVSAGKIGFPEVEKVLNKLTGAGGQFYNLMEKQSASITGLIANLGDAWDSALNKIGEENQEVFSAGLTGAINLVENLDEVIKILKAAAIAYGTYKAAILANTLVTRGYTGVAFLNNTVIQSKNLLLKAEARLSTDVAAQTKAMTEANKERVATLQAELTAEEQSMLVKKLRIAQIQQLLTAQQQEYLSNLGLTTSSQGYEAAAMGVMNVEQKVAMAKLDLSEKSAIYRAALEQEVIAKKASSAASLEAMRTEVKAAAQKVESAKSAAVSALQASEAARYELYWAKQSGDATRIATAEKKLEGAQENAAIARKAALAAQTDFYTKKKTLEAAATKAGTVASQADTAAKSAQTAATTILSAATGKLTTAVKTLWATMKANPLGWILTLVGLVISAFSLFSKEEKEASTAMGDFQKATKDEIDRLNVLMAVLRNTESNTKSHKDAVGKINEICKEYNKTLLDENATLEEQEAKYRELTKAIQETTAEKIKAKYTEQYLKDQADANDKARQKLQDRAEDATYQRGTGRFRYNRSTGDEYEITETVELEHIQAAQEYVWEAVEGIAAEHLSKLRGKTGEEYTKAFNEVLGVISNAVQESTEATDEEMEHFKGTLGEYLQKIVDNANEADAKIAGLNDRMGKFFARQTPEVAEDIDYTKWSFSDLEQKIQDTQKEIDIINQKEVNFQTEDQKKRLQELLDLMNQLNSAVSNKTQNLNTEAGISARIKELREQRANVEINSAKYKELSKQIDELNAKLPHNTGSGRKGGSGRGGVNDRLNAEKRFNEMVLDVDRKLEDARLAILEEGYDKRKQALDLQHKRNLEQINKEEKELAEARKKAGKGSLTKEEKAGFQERREIENKSYANEQNKLFDGEIAYKKQQYELYFRWVRNIGEDVANKQFENLLKGGNSYKQYVENEIHKLEEKRKAGTLTEGEGNQLISLNMQMNEILGAKSAMDSFKESVRKTVSQASSLAEKLQAVADAREKLSNGTSGLVGADEQAQASLFLSEEEEKYQQEIQDKVLENYRTYEEKKKIIQTDFAAQRLVAQKMNDEERLRLINEAETRAISELNASFLQQSADWKRLFDNMEDLSASAIVKLLENIESKLKDADLKLNPVDMKALTDSLNKAKEELIEKNPFKAINKFYDDYIKAKEKLAKAKKDLADGKGSQKDVDDAKSEVVKATNGIIKSVNKVVSASTEAATSLASMFDALGMSSAAEGLQNAVELLGALGDGAASVGKLMSGDVLGGVTGLIGAASSVVGIFSKMHDAKYEKRIKALQNEIDALDRSFNRMQRAFNNTYWVYSDEEKAQYDQRKKALQEQISMLEQQAQKLKETWKFKEYAQTMQKIQNLKAELTKHNESGDMFSLQEAQIANLRQQQEDMRQQIQNERDKKKTDWDRIKEWENAIEDIDQQIEDLNQSMMETLAGTTVKTALDEFASALVDAYCQGQDAAEALGEKTKAVLKNAVVEALKRRFLAKAIDEAVNYLGEAMKDNVLSDAEKEHFEYLVNQGGEAFNKALESIGDWIKDADEASKDPLTGAVQSMSEETAGVVAGRLNAVIINQSEANAIMRNALIHQAEIAQNTYNTVQRLNEVRDILKRMESQESSLLSQGIS